VLACWSAVHSIASITSVTYTCGAGKEPAVLVCWSAVHSIVSITAVTYLWWREVASCDGMLVSCALHYQHKHLQPICGGGKEPAVLLCWSAVHPIASISFVTYL
jgi:hypothetical protein